MYVCMYVCQVTKLFDHVQEIAEDEECFVSILIDEVESMASARQSAMKSNEPSDAVRCIIPFLQV